MKTLSVVALWALNVLTSIWADVAGWTNWGLLGWAFAGSTAFVVWEMIQEKPPKRTGLQRAAMIGLGMIVSLGFNAWLSERWSIPIVPATVGLGMLGYKLLTWFQKKGDDPEKAAEDFTTLTKP